MWIALLVAAALAVHQVWRLSQALAAPQARRQLRDLRELVTAWQLANGDEVSVMHRRVAEAHSSMAAAEQAARVSGSQLTRLERSRPEKLA